MECIYVQIERHTFLQKPFIHITFTKFDSQVRSFCINFLHLEILGIETRETKPNIYQMDSGRWEQGC